MNARALTKRGVPGGVHGAKAKAEIAVQGNVEYKASSKQARIDALENLFHMIDVRNQLQQSKIKLVETKSEKNGKRRPKKREGGRSSTELVCMCKKSCPIYLNTHSHWHRRQTEELHADDRQRGIAAQD
jgi:hypothetical protein